MIAIEKNILEALTELDSTVKGMAVNPKPDLQPLFARLSELERQLPRDADPNLRHYLQRKSYEKARLLLEGRKLHTTRGII